MCVTARLSVGGTPLRRIILLRRPHVPLAPCSGRSTYSFALGHLWKWKQKQQNIHLTKRKCDILNYFDRCDMSANRLQYLTDVCHFSLTLCSFCLCCVFYGLLLVVPFSVCVCVCVCVCSGLGLFLVLLLDRAQTWGGGAYTSHQQLFIKKESNPR